MKWTTAYSNRFRQARVVLSAALLGAAIVTAGNAFASGDSSDDTAKKETSGGDANYTKAVKAVEGKDFAGALALLADVVKKDPGNADAWNYMGFADRQLGKFPDSLTAYEKALAIQPKHLGANEYLGELYVQTGEKDKAQAQLAKLLSLCGANCDEYKALKAAISSGKTASLN